jgi:hypothetical protein
MSLVVNLFGCAGAGKSTLAAGTFYELKLAGYNAELIPEYAKSKVWAKDAHTLANQAYVTIKQYYMQDRPHGQVDCIITDSPILLGVFYQKKGCTKSFIPYMLELFNSYNNLNIMLIMGDKQKESFSEVGRIHDLKGSLEREAAIKKFLVDNNIDHHEVIVNGRSTLSDISKIISPHLQKPKNPTFE